MSHADAREQPTWTQKAIVESFRVWRDGALAIDDDRSEEMQALQRLLREQEDVVLGVFLGGWMQATTLIHDFAARAAFLECPDEAGSAG